MQEGLTRLRRPGPESQPAQSLLVRRAAHDGIAGVLVIACNLSAPFGAPCTDFGLDTAEDRTVTDATNKLYFFELATTPDVIWVDLNWLDFKAGAPVMTLDPNNIAVSSDVTDKFTPACAPY